MKKIDINETTLQNFVGSVVHVWCVNYIYAGKLEAVVDDYLVLSGMGVSYETGELTLPKLKNFEPFRSLGTAQPTSQPFCYLP